MKDAEEICANLARLLSVEVESVMPFSTGVIGERLPLQLIKDATERAVMDMSGNKWLQAAEAIMTTDTVPKLVEKRFSLGNNAIVIGGMAKGSGMIHPDMATMLAFVTCDAAVSTGLWQEMLTQAANESFNQITVDGDTSTNDSLIALANGQSRTPAITDLNSKNAQTLQQMLTAVCQHLAKAIARDGEGATCLVEVQVSGAPDDPSARRIAKTIVGSSLVKSAIFGRDPNWGRIAGAAGRAGVKFRQEELRITLGEYVMMENGQPLEYDRNAASNYMKQAAQGAYLEEDTVLITVCVGNGSGNGIAWGCDLSYDYVKINAEYTT